MTKKQREEHKLGNQIRSHIKPWYGHIQTGRYTRSVRHAITQAARSVQQLDTTPLSAATRES